MIRDVKSARSVPVWVGAAGEFFKIAVAMAMILAACYLFGEGM